MAQPPLQGLRAAVTGGTSGLGRALVTELLRRGACVAFVARHVDEVRRTAWERPGAHGIVGDVSHKDDIYPMALQITGTLGGLDILVNNAGIMVRGPLLQVDPAGYRRMLDINVTGTIQCTRLALPVMIERKYGRIINLSTQLAQRAVGGGGFAAYAATKGAVESLTRALASEVGCHGITVNAIAPGGIETDMSKDVMTPEYRTRRLAELPLRRFGSVEDVAYCAVVLASEEAGYLTGQILHPSGGWVSG